MDQSLQNWLVSVPDWHLSGANTFMQRLLKSAVRNGKQARIIATTPVDYDRELLAPRPDDIPFINLPATPWKAVASRQRQLHTTLLEHRPGVFFPNYDFDLAAVSRALPEDLVTVFIVHSDEEGYYQSISEHGDCYNLIVAVSQLIETRLKERFPQYIDRIVRIPYGVDVPPDLDKNYEGRLQLVYSGRLAQTQKRIMDLAGVINECETRQLPVDFTILGDGPDAQAFREALPQTNNIGLKLLGTLSFQQAQQELGKAHAIVLTSEYEGLPLTLLESMAQGLVPVLTQFRSGLDELIDGGHNGLLSPVADQEKMVDNIEHLSKDVELRARIGRQARQTIASGSYNIEHCYEEYLTACAQAPRLQRNSRLTPVIPRHYTWRFRLTKRLRRILNTKSPATF